MPQYASRHCSFAAVAGFAALSVLLAAVSAVAGQRDATIINTDLEREFVRIVTMTDENVYVDLGGGRSRAMPLDRCMAILFGDRENDPDRETGQLHLADGQRYVGTLVADADLPDDVVAWSHPLLGRLEFKLDSVRAVTLPAGDGSPLPEGSRVEPDLADVVVLRNGDQLHGFIMTINDPIELELVGNGDDPARIIQLPMDRVASVSMIAPTLAASGRRLWLIDGTIMAVQSVILPEEGEIDATGRWHGSGTQTVNLPRGSIAAMLIDAERITPLSSIAPTRVDGPATRYLVSDPVVLDDAPLLGASRIEYRGPVTVHYALPAGTARFAAEATLPQESRTWGDFELVIRIDGREVDRRAVNAAHPTATINISVDGSELTLELREGDSGPVQNHLILSRALLLQEG